MRALVEVSCLFQNETATSYARLRFSLKSPSSTYVDGFDALFLLAILVTDFPAFPARFPSDLPNNWFAIDFGLELRWLRDGGNAGVRLSR